MLIDLFQEQQHLSNQILLNDKQQTANNTTTYYYYFSAFWNFFTHRNVIINYYKK